MLECYRCSFPGEDFEFKLNYKKSPPTPTNLCLNCVKQANTVWRKNNRIRYNTQTRQRRLERKQKAIAYKGGKCEECQQVVHHAAFDFHHVDPTQKDKDLGLMMTHSDTKLFEELDKCKLLCANCHRIFHFENGY
jgi:hypothetical protein